MITALVIFFVLLIELPDTLFSLSSTHLSVALFYTSLTIYDEFIIPFIKNKNIYQTVKILGEKNIGYLLGMVLFSISAYLLNGPIKLNLNNLVVDMTASLVFVFFVIKNCIDYCKFRKLIYKENCRQQKRSRLLQLLFFIFKT